MFKYYRNYVLFVLFIGGMINYLDRSAFPIMATLIAKDLNLEPAQMGLILSAFFLGYAVFNFVGGYCSDKWGPHKTINFSMMGWSVFVGLTGLCFNFVSLFIARVLFGCGEGPIASATSRFVYNWFPMKERSVAIGLVFSGNPIGAALSGPIVGFLAIYLGWRYSFLILTFIGFLWVIWWTLAAKNFPRESENVSAQELKEIEEGQEDLNSGESSNNKAPLRYFLKQKTILATAFAFWTYSYILYFFLSWFPTYLISERNLNIKEMSVASVVPWAVGSVGLILSGYVTNWIFLRTNKVLFSRKIMIIGGLLISAVCLFFTPKVSTSGQAVALMAVAVAAMYMTGTCYWTIIHEVIPKENVGGVTGFTHFIANTAGIVAPSLTGFFVQFTKSYGGAFALAGALAIMGAIFVGLFVRPIRN